MERTFMMIKPDGVERGLIGEILRRVELRGLKISAIKLMWITPELAREHYIEHRDKAFFPELEKYITSGPVVAMVLEGDHAIEIVRNLNGATDPIKALPGTIRGDYCVHKSMNLVHGSDSLESAEREIKLFFAEEEIMEYQRAIERWI